MRSHDVIILFILPEKTINAANGSFMDKWSVFHYYSRNISFKECSEHLNCAGYPSWLRKQILLLVKSKLLTLNISGLNPYSLPLIFIILSDFIYFLNSWNNKLLCLPAMKTQQQYKIKYSNIIFHTQLLIHNLFLYFKF